MTRFPFTKKGVAVIYVVLLGTLVLISLLFIVLDQTLGKVNNATIEDIEATDYTNTNTKLDGIWLWFLVVCFGSVLSWAMLSTMKRP